MQGLLKHRPSPALVISIVALVMASVGTGIAAFKLPNNSVGSKQLKNNAVVTKKIKKEAVTGAKVKKNSLTGKNINLNKLGTVPAATSATTAATAQALTPNEPIHRVGAPGEPVFEEGATNFGPFIAGLATQAAGFYKDHEGIVHLVGLVKAGELGALFRLPPGFRPANGTLEFFITNEVAIAVAGSNAGEGGSASGIVLAFGGAKGETVTLSGITFRAES
jgi:hypothetical protein